MQENKTRMPITLDIKTHESLRKISYETKMSMNALINLAIEKILRKYEKKID